MPLPAQPAPTMRDLAAALKVSVTTISHALRNHPDVAPETRKRIQTYARDNGYRLNPSVTAFMSRVRNADSARYRETLAWINAWDAPDFFVHRKPNLPSTWQLQWKGASNRAAELGFELETFWLHEPGMTGKKMSRILTARGIRGLLIPPIPSATGHLSLDWSQFAATALSYSISRPQLHRVVSDCRYNMQLILRQLRRRRYRKIGLLTSPGFDTRMDNIPLSTFYFYQHDIPAQNRVPVLACRPGAEEICAAWLKEHRPDAVIISEHCVDLRAIEIGDPGYSRRLGMVKLGIDPVYPKLSAMDGNSLLIGAAAVEHLSAQLNRNERGIPPSPHTVLIKGSWLEGETLGKKR